MIPKNLGRIVILNGVHYRRTENLLNNTLKLKLLLSALFCLSHSAPKDMDASTGQVTR